MTFNEVLNKFRAESFTQKDKGTQFERLMRSWLLSDPRYSNLTDVWMWEDFPSKKDFGGKDTGIDLVARTDTGEYWAIQCKCYKEDAVIDKPAVDSFLATSSRTFLDVDSLQTTSFARRVWISTTNHWAPTPRKQFRIRIRRLTASVSWICKHLPLIGNCFSMDSKAKMQCSPANSRVSISFVRCLLLILILGPTTEASSLWLVAPEKHTRLSKSPRICYRTKDLSFSSCHPFRCSVRRSMLGARTQPSL